MVATQIALFRAPSSGPEDDIQNALSSANVASSQDTTAGLQIQDRNVIQVISENRGLIESTIFHTLRSLCDEPTASYDIELNDRALGPDGPATAPILEVVANYFPASRVTPEFQKQIEAEFAEFDRICLTMAEGNIGLAHGWSVNEIDRADAEGGKIRPFFILRGWRSMQDFENLTKEEKFRQEAVPKLMAWGAPFEMWHVERKD